MWYGASILLEARHQVESPPSSLWEESIVLIDADTEEEARLSAEAVGRQREHEYTVGEPGHVLRWTFVRVERIFRIEASDLVHGTEVFSRFLKATQVESLGALLD